MPWRKGRQKLHVASESVISCYIYSCITCKSINYHLTYICIYQMRSLLSVTWNCKSTVYTYMYIHMFPLPCLSSSSSSPPSPLLSPLPSPLSLTLLMAFHLPSLFLPLSDDRSAEFFSQKLEAATQMQAVLTPDSRPTCLIIDEIDGAPTVSIVIRAWCRCTHGIRSQIPKVFCCWCTCIIYSVFTLLVW